MEAQKKKKGKKLASRPMEASKPNEDLRAPQETSPAFEFPHFDLIVHANTCRKAGLTNCSFPRCSEIQKFIVHMKSCNLEEPCPISLCNFYQSGNCHKKTCKSPDSCKVCEHLTNVKARIRVN